MITEDYCSYEVAKLLKEKGFDESTSMVYMPYGDLCKLDRYDSIRNSNYNDITKNYFEYTAPTHQMAMKWLREVHSLCICIYYLWPCGYEIDLYRIGKDTPISEFETIREYGYDTYEGAVEAALKYCLENLV